MFSPANKAKFMQHLDAFTQHFYIYIISRFKQLMSDHSYTILY